MNGQMFGKLYVSHYVGSNKSGSALWFCVCACGNTRTIAGTGLRAGRHKSCGCASPRFNSERVKKHGMSFTRTYKIWNGMKTRCSDKAQTRSRKLYYEKGIRVCERWMKFENFLEDMGEAPEGLTLDRIDGNGNYEPGNCRWATYLEQANNTSANVVIKFNGLSKTVAEWGRFAGIKGNTITTRLRRGASIEKAIFKPVRAKTDERRLLA